MMSINEIKNYSFSLQRGGMYKSTEVDSVFDEVKETLDALTAAYEKAKRENDELYKKMDILADRIEEYRKDEDSVRTVLLTAQKMADKLVKEAREQSAAIIEEANAKADEAISSIKTETDNYVIENKNKADEYLRKAKLDYDAKMSGIESKAQAIIDAANAEAEKVINDAEAKSNEIIAKSNIQADDISSNTTATIEHAQKKLNELKALTSEFKTNVISVLNKQIELFESIGVDDGEYSAEYYASTYRIDSDAVYHPEFTAEEFKLDEIDTIDSPAEAEIEYEEEIIDEAEPANEDEEIIYDTEEFVDEDQPESEDIVEFEEVDEYEDISSVDTSEDDASAQNDSVTLDYFDELMKSLSENPVEDRSVLHGGESFYDEQVLQETVREEEQDEIQEDVFEEPIVDKRNIFTRLDLEEGLDDEEDGDSIDRIDTSRLSDGEQLKFGKDFDIFDDDDDMTQGTFFGKFKKK